jgi:hypothetical protein
LPKRIEQWRRIFGSARGIYKPYPWHFRRLLRVGWMKENKDKSDYYRKRNLLFHGSMPSHRQQLLTVNAGFVAQGSTILFKRHVV